MIQAAVNLHEQWVHLVILVMAILQPLIVLLLILGLILATAHLLTMLGTRWGDRKASSKSLLFSLGLHVLLGGAIIAMIPDYRARIYAEIAFVDQIPIQMHAPLDPRLDPADHFDSGNVPLWDRLPPSAAPVNPQFELHEFRLPEPEPAAPAQSQEFTPAPVEDRVELPPESRPVPTQEFAINEARLEEAVAQPQVNTIQREIRPEAAPASADRQRSELGNLVQEDQTVGPRPVIGGVDRITPTPQFNDETRSLADIASPTANMRRADLDNQNIRRDGPAPADVQTELAGRAPTGETFPAPSQGVSQPRLTRTPLGNPFTSNPDLAAQPSRPDVRPILPNGTDTTPQSSVSGRSELTPDSPVQPELARLTDGNLPESLPGQGAATYTLRAEEQRQLAILKYGGSEKSEAAVDRALAWLASVQEPEGHWSASKHGAGRVEKVDNGPDRGATGLKADAGVTALAVLAFLGKANTLTEGKYSPNVHRALRWLVNGQKTLDWTQVGTYRTRPAPTPGYLGGEAAGYEAIYCHAMATFALAEAYALSRDEVDAQWLLPAIENAVQFILETQIDDGSWRYFKGQEFGDMSIFGWQLMALKSAETAGIPIPVETKLNMARFLKWSERGLYGGLAAYHPSASRYVNKTSQPASQISTPSMTAEALFCRQMLGLANSERMTGEAAEFLLKNLPSRTQMDFYYWYYGTLSMHQQGGRDWDTWNLAVRDLLISEQTTTGELAGSWEPRDIWGPYGGRIYSTAIATLTLEVYYRYLPLYRINER